VHALGCDVELLARAAQAALAAIDHAAEPLRAAALYERLGEYTFWDDEPALECYRHALALLPADAAGERARVLAAEGRALMGLRRLAEARERCEVALEQAHAAGDALQAARARTTLGVVLAYLGELALGERELRAALEEADGAGEESARAHVHLAELLRLRGEHALALAIAEEASTPRRAPGCAPRSGTSSSSTRPTTCCGSGAGPRRRSGSIAPSAWSSAAPPRRCGTRSPRRAQPPLGQARSGGLERRGNRLGGARRALPGRVCVVPRRARIPLAQPAPEAAAATDDDDGGLSAREADVLALLADGLTNREIAERLFISQKTVAPTSRTSSASSPCTRASRPPAARASSACSIASAERNRPKVWGDATQRWDVATLVVCSRRSPGRILARHGRESRPTPLKEGPCPTARSDRSAASPRPASRAAP
jgi:tetratricopeptide (TPR) repeat protein